ncbi:MAG: WYL domain-containing protein, partial [Bacteroidales bacterium]|nr:WYL domain-containing protein [Bacteroidales bacterium]
VQVSRDSAHCINAMNLIPNPAFVMELCKRGSRLEVLEPQSLREAVKEELKNALNQYEDS